MIRVKYANAEIQDDGVMKDAGLLVGGYTKDLEDDIDDLQEDIEQLNDEIVNYNNTKVGYSEVENGQLKMYSDSTKAHLLATLDLPTSGITDVKANGTSIVTDGVANIPFASASRFGVVKSNAYNGVWVNGSGEITANKAYNSDIDSRSTSALLTANVVPYAVKSALTSETDPAWTSEQQNKALARLGIPNEWTKIQKIITEADVVDGEPPYILFNIPSGATEFLYNFAIKRTDTTACYMNLNLSEASGWSSRQLFSSNNTYSQVSYRGHSKLLGAYIITDFCNFQSQFIAENSDSVLPNDTNRYCPRKSDYANKLYFHCSKGIAVGSELTLWYR